MRWTRGGVVGRGSSATVYLAGASPSGEPLAVKSAELKFSGSLQKEQKILSQLNSPQIVRYMGFDITAEGNKQMYNLFMEYAPNGTVSDAIRRNGGSLDEPTIGSYTRRILQGLDCVHRNGWVHCDIKSDNVLVQATGVQIADFGCARSVEQSSRLPEFSGTPAFMSPEVARGEEQGFPADVWALGCTVIEMATGRGPWPEEDSPVSALYRIGFSSESPEIPLRLSETGKDFLGKCLRRNPEERWTVKQLLEHPFCNLQLGCQTEEAIEKLTWNSPTSVLDQGLWDSVEVSEIARDPTIRIGSGSNDPSKRIMNLNGGAMESGWRWDEDWITVRRSCSGIS